MISDWEWLMLWSLSALWLAVGWYWTNRIDPPCEADTKEETK